MKKYRVTKKQMEKIHPAIPEAHRQLEEGRISRRDFLRLSTLLGMSAGVAYVASACGGPEEAAAPGGEAGRHRPIVAAQEAARETNSR